MDINWACWPEMVIGFAFGMLTMAVMMRKWRGK